jgi:Fe-S-cluster containining protein
MIKMEAVDICSIQCKSKCCKSTPPALTTKDFNRITEAQNTEKWFHYLNKEGKGTKVISKKGEGIDCYFLSNENLCDIYKSRPLDCELFPIFLKIKEIKDNEYNIRWLVWYCPLTETKGVDPLLEQAKEIVKNILVENPEQIFEYQEAMYASKGYKKKHFLYEERLKIIRR